MSLGGRLDTNIQIKPNKLRKSSVFVIPGQLFSYSYNRWLCFCIFPSRYLRSVVQNLQLIQRFKKQAVEHSPQRERLNFWMDIIVEATQGTTNRLRFPVQTHKDTNTQTRMTRYSTFGTLTFLFFHYRCWFWSRLRSTSPPTCPLTTRLKRRTSPSGTFLLQRRWEWNTTFFTPGGMCKNILKYIKHVTSIRFTERDGKENNTPVWSDAVPWIYAWNKPKWHILITFLPNIFV